MARIDGSDDKVARYNPFYREFISTRNIVILFFAVSSIAFGAALTIMGDALDPGKIHTGTFIIYITSSIALNGGIGLVVSLIVSSLILRDQRFEVQIDLDSRIKAMADNVLRGVLSLDHDPAYIKEVRSLALIPSITRDNCSIKVDMSLYNSVYEDSVHTYVVLNIFLSYTIVNVSLENTEFCPTLILPNPMRDDVKHLVSIKSFIVGTSSLSDMQISKINLDAQRKLSDNNNPEASFNGKKVSISSGHSVNVSMEYTIVKETEDNELFLVSMPTKDMRLSVRDNTSQQYTLFAKSLHSTQISPSSSATVQNGWAEWRIPGWCLPKQGMLFWWKKRDRLDGTPLEPDLFPDSIENATQEEP